MPSDIVKSMRGSRNPRNPKPSGKRSQKYMKKTSRKGAYKKAPKKAMKNRMRPFVESHRHVSGQLGTSSAHLANALIDDAYQLNPENTTASAFNIIIPDTYIMKTSEKSLTNPERGYIDGEAIFGKFQSTKLLFNFPQDAYHLTAPTRIYVYQLWVKSPYGRTPYTSPTRDAGLIGASQGNQTTNVSLEGHVQQQCKEWFSSRQDFMEFKELKDNPQVKIIKRDKITVNRNSQIQDPAANLAGVNGSNAGGVSPILKTYTWNINRKMHYEHTSAPYNASQGFIGFDYYLNNGWYPALVIFNPDFKNQGLGDPNVQPVTDPADHTKSSVGVEYNNCLWYTDQ